MPGSISKGINVTGTRIPQALESGLPKYQVIPHSPQAAIIAVNIVSYHAISREDLHQRIDDFVATDNLFCALRIDGCFSYVETRTVPRQERPYKPMLEAIAQQPTFRFDNCKGNVIGFRSPAYVQGINVAGYHEHFITDSRQGGGHILDYRLENGVLQFGTIAKLIIDLPLDKDFLRADLSPEDLDSVIHSVES